VRKRKGFSTENREISTLDNQRPHAGQNRTDKFPLERLLEWYQPGKLAGFLPACFRSARQDLAELVKTILANIFAGRGSKM